MMKLTDRRSNGSDLPWGLLLLIALITGYGLLFLWGWARFPSLFA